MEFLLDKPLDQGCILTFGVILHDNYTPFYLTKQGVPTRKSKNNLVPS